MKPLMCSELPTASAGSSQATTAAVDNFASFVNRPQPTYKSGKVVQTTGATSLAGVGFATIGGRSLKKDYRKIQWEKLKTYSTN